MNTPNFSLRSSASPWRALAIVASLIASAASAQFATTLIGSGAPGSIRTNVGFGSYEVVAGGNDIWDSRDDFTFHHFAAQGTQFDLRVRVESVDANAPLTKAGLMVRESLTSTSRMAFVRVTPAGVTLNNQFGSNDVRFSYRTGTANAAQGQHEDPVARWPTPGYPSAWVRLERHGNLLSGYSSSNGTAWLLLGSQDSSAWSGGAFAAGNYSLGLAQSAGPNGASATAKVQYREFNSGTNLPPTISDAPDLVLARGGALVSIPYVIGDADTPVADLIFFASSANPSVLPNENLSVGGVGTNRILEIRPGTNAPGTSVITVTALDSTGLRAMDLITVTMIPGNNPPSISVIGSQSGPEDSVIGPVGVTVNDTETPATALILSASSTNAALLPAANIVFGGSGSNRTLHLFPATNQFGVSRVTVTVTDGLGAIAQTSFDVTVTPSNDPPTILAVGAKSGPEDVPLGPVILSITDIDSLLTLTNLSASSSNTTLLPNQNIVFGVSGTNFTVTLFPATNQFGVSRVTLTVNDGGGGVAQTAFNVTFISVVDPPQLVSFSQAIVADAGTSITLSMTAVGEPPLRYQWFKDGAAIPDATNSTYTIGQARGTASGNYHGTVENTGGGSTTPPIPVDVREYDYGDAPFATRAPGGARHRYVPDVRLGQFVDFELDGQPNSTASGDDDGAPLDDEDGVTFNSLFEPGRTARVDVNTSAKGLLNVWIDFDGNHVFEEGSEHVVMEQFLLTGTTPGIAIPVPASATPGVSYARFRFSTQAGLGPQGTADDGEVEDYMIVIESPPPPPRCDFTCLGTNFWLTFPGNYAPDPEHPPELTLCLTGPTGTRVHVEIADDSFTTDVIVPSEQFVRLPLPTSLELGSLNDATVRKGIHVTAPRDIGIVALNYVAFSSDGYLALPVETLGTEYIVQAHPNAQAEAPELNGTQFAVVATEDGTIVSITPSVRAGRRRAASTYSVTLSRGAVYQLRNTNDATADLTGTIVKADKPIAVFGGHPCGFVQSTNVFFCNYLVEQLLPVARWGNDFMTQPFVGRAGGDTFRILSAEDDTSVTFDGVPTYVLHRGQVVTNRLSSGTRISSDHPISLTQFAHGSEVDGTGDPTMVTVTPIRLFSESHTVCTGPATFSRHYVNIITRFGVTVTLDGSTVSLIPLGISGFFGAQIPVAPGRHQVNGSGPVGVMVYGWGDADAYAWPGCFRFGDTTPPTVVCLTNFVVRTNLPGLCSSPMPDLRSFLTATDACSVALTFAQTPAIGTALSHGETSANIVVSDASGNEVRCNFTVSVVDTSPPLISCPSAVVTNCAVAGESVRVTYRVTARTACQTNLPVFCVPSSGSRFNIGSTPVFCSATNSMTGSTAQCQFAVTVNCAQVGVSALGGQIRLEWTGNNLLQGAPTVNGPWITLSNLVSPTVISPSGPMRFFRAFQF